MNDGPGRTADATDAIAPGDAFDPSEAFDAVANELRFAILRALWGLADGPRDGASFSAIRERAGVRDSGQFNYHLDRLRPQFLRKDDDEYRLTEAGRQVVGAVISGVYTDLDVAVEPRPVRECRGCGGSVELRYENGFIVVGCPDCERHVLDMSTPPVAVGSCDPGQVPAVLSRHALTEIQRMNRGFCVYCGGLMDATVDRCPGEEAPEIDVEFACRACGRTFAWSVAAAALDHPAVVSLLHRAGTDVRETPVWEILDRIDPSVTVDEADPIRVVATVRVGDGAVDLTFDEQLDVVEYAEHAPAGDATRGI